MKSSANAWRARFDRLAVLHAIWVVLVCYATGAAFWLVLGGFAEPRHALAIWVELASWTLYFTLLTMRAWALLPMALSTLYRWMPILVSALLGFHVVVSFRFPAWLVEESAAQTVNRMASWLSSAWFGLPVRALTYAWALWAVAALVRQSTAEALRSWTARSPKICRAIGWLAFGWVLAFGTLAVLGYATGSPWLFAR